MTIYALDPGETTGWAVVVFDGETPAVWQYGAVERAPDWPGTLVLLGRWLTEHVFYHPDGWPAPDAICFEEWVPAMSLASRKEAQEARGVIRYRLEDWRRSCNAPAWSSYQPRQVRAALGVATGAKKAAIRTRIEELLDTKLAQKAVDAVDAIAVALTHLVRSGLWTPGLVVTPTGTARAQRVADEQIDGTTPAGRAKLARLLAEGKARVRRR